MTATSFPTTWVSAKNSGSSLTLDDLTSAYNQWKAKKQRRVGELLPQLITKTMDKSLIDFIAGFRPVRFFQGGTSQDFRETKKLVGQWQTLALTHKLIPKKLPLHRLAVFGEKQLPAYLDLKPTINLRHSKILYQSHSNGWPLALTDYALQVFKDALVERQTKHDDLALIETEILRRGGMLLGVYKQKLILFFPLAAETAMAKLTGKKNSYLHPEDVADSDTIMGLVINQRTDIYSKILRPSYPPDDDDWSPYIEEEMYKYNKKREEDQEDQLTNKFAKNLEIYGRKK